MLTLREQGVGVTDALGFADKNIQEGVAGDQSIQSLQTGALNTLSINRISTDVGHRSENRLLVVWQKRGRESLVNRGRG